MTKEDAIKIVNILATADGGCGPCVQSLVSDFLEAYPEFKQDAKAILIKYNHYWSKEIDKGEWECLE